MFLIISEMKLFIHGDENRFPGSVSYRDGEKYSAEVYFRFGGDSNNYYEYRQPVDSGWNEVKIIFSELTAIKQARDSINTVTKVPVADMPGHFYQVRGNPSLTGIKFLTVGIKNIMQTFAEDPARARPISGEVWVNELRVVGADDTPGWAYSFGTNLKMADLLTLNFNMSKTDPNFHKTCR
jgi:cell surface protein SprA